MDIETIFAEAISKPAKLRKQFLADACKDDEQLRRQVDALIAAHQSHGGFLDDAVNDQTLPHEPTVAQGQKIGPYKLLQQLGEGGMGVVYMAERQEPVKQRVALKIIKLGMDSKNFVARFEAERQALAMMDHPNIAKVLDAGCVEESTLAGRPYFVMELVKGVPVTEFCDKNQLSTKQRLEIFIQICKAVQHAHQKGIIHRDIKPSNVLVALYDDKPVPKVIDFGVAKATNQQLTEKTLFTEVGAIMGTWEYMSPEQAVLNQLDVDTRTDVYSLGVLLYELLTGVTPLDHEQLRQAQIMETLRMIREDVPPRPSLRLSSLGQAASATAAYRKSKPESLVAEIRGDLDWIVMKGLEKDRQRRYESPVALARDVQRFLEKQPVDAGPPSLVYRTRKFSQRHQKALWASSAVAFMLFVCVAWAFFNWSNWNAKRRLAGSLVSDALEKASLDLGRAANSSIGDDTDWTKAHASYQRVLDLSTGGMVEADVWERVEAFMAKYKEAVRSRQLASQIEKVVINGATHEDLPSWMAMDRNMESLFRDQGMDFDKQSPEEIAQMMKDDPNNLEQLAEALELWIGTRAYLGMLGGPPATGETMQAMADALYAADDDPLRTGIRRIIYERQTPTREQVEKMIEGIDLRSRSPRTLSWLTSVMVNAGMDKEADEMILEALDDNPHDLMLNFDHAYGLAMRGRWNEAIRYYIRCTALRQNVPGIWRGLGVAYRNNGELEASKKALNKSLVLQDYAPTWVDLARTQIEMNDRVAALLSADKAIELSAEYAESWSIKGRALMAAENYEEALKAFDEYQRLGTGKNPAAIKSLIEKCKEQLGDRE